MATIKSGASSDQLTIDATSKAARTTSYDSSGNYVHPQKVAPLSLGSYSLFQASGLLAAGAQTNGEMYQFRWTDATRVCVLRRIIICFSPVTAYAAGQLTINAILARSFTAVGSGTGSAAATLSTNNSNKKKTSFGSSLLADTNSVIMGTGVLSAGTKTMDNNAFSGLTGNAITPTSSTALVLNEPLYIRDANVIYPIVFVQNEGFVIRLTCPGTGTAYFSVIVEWDEQTTTEL